LTGGAVQPPLFHSAHNTAASVVSTSSAAPLFNPVQLHESNDTSSSALFHSAHDTAASAVSTSSAAPSFNPVQLHESNNTSSSAALSNPVQISIKRMHEHATTVTCKTVTMFGTFLVYTLLCLYAWKSHFMLVRDIGEPTPGYT